MPDEDPIDGVEVAIILVILTVVIGILIYPWVFGLAGQESGLTPGISLSDSSFSDEPSGLNSFKIAAYDSSAASKYLADYICDGIQDQDEINAAFKVLPKGGEVILSEGTFNVNAAISLTTGITLRGQGDTKTFLKLTDKGNILVDKEYVTLEQFHVSAKDRSAVYGGAVTIRAGHCAVHNVTGTCDKTVPAVFLVLTTDKSGYNKIIEDIEFANCKAFDCGGFGFRHDAKDSSYTLIRNVRYTDCQAINCGRYERYYDWITGFDFAENNDLDNLRVTGCIAEGCWESGFHFEYRPTTTDAILTDCIARNNGQKPYPNYQATEATFGAGYTIGRGEVTLVNCQAEGNTLHGFYINDGSGMKLYGCTDKDTAISRNDFSVQKPSSFFILNTWPGRPVLMEDCSSTDSNGHALLTGYKGDKLYYTEARLKNFVVTNAAGVDGTAIQLNHIRSGSDFDIHASGNRASTVISVYDSLGSDFTGSIVSDVAKPFVIDGSRTANTVVHDFETVSSTLPAESTGITVTENVPAGAVQMVNCHVISPTSSSGFLSELWYWIYPSDVITE